MLRRRFRTFINAGIHFVARRPAIHSLIKLAYPLVPGLQPALRRFLPQPVSATSSLAKLEEMLKFNRNPVLSEPGGTVTVEQLCSLSASH